MENNKNRFQDFEKKVTLLLLGVTFLFIIFLIASGCGIVWLKIITAIIAILICGLCLALLYMTKLLLRPRSLWMSVASGSFIVCILFSLILGFPFPL